MKRTKQQWVDAVNNMPDIFSPTQLAKALGMHVDAALYLYLQKLELPKFQMSPKRYVFNKVDVQRQIARLPEDRFIVQFTCLACNKVFQGSAKRKLCSKECSINHNIQPSGDHLLYNQSSPTFYWEGKNISLRNQLYLRAYNVDLHGKDKVLLPQCGEAKCVKAEHQKLFDKPEFMKENMRRAKSMQTVAKQQATQLLADMLNKLTESQVDMVRGFIKALLLMDGKE